MNSKKTEKSTLSYVLKILCTSVVLFLLVIAGIYFALFKPTFLRGQPHTEKQNLAYFGSKENMAKHEEDVDWINSHNPEELCITSFDGLKLYAIVLPETSVSDVKADDANNVKGTVLLMHGYHSDPLREFASLARFYSESGYNVVLPYQRTHGKSEGKYITFGVKERFDCRDWITETNKRFGDTLPLFVEGISMGCATVVMTSGFDNLPFNVRGFIADCGFTSPYEIIYYVAKYERKLPLCNFIIAVCEVMTTKIADFSLTEYSTITALKTNPRPVLFIHGTADDFVPSFMSQQNFEACRADRELYLVDGAKHAVSNMVDHDNYTKRVTAFMDKYGVK